MKEKSHRLLEKGGRTNSLMIRRMVRFLTNRGALWLAGLGLVLLSGGVQGMLTGRWRTSSAWSTAVARVPQVPYQIGPWQGRDLDVDPLPFRQARVDSYWVRRYERTGQAGACVAILMCGRSGPLAVHTPEVCYPGAGYQMHGSARRLTLPLPGGALAELWTARFRREEAGSGPLLQLFWSWSAEGSWQAPRWPRWTFAGRPFLYKLYVLRELADSGEAVALQDPAVDFLTALLPVLEQTLFAPASGPESAGDEKSPSALAS